MAAQVYPLYAEPGVFLVVMAPADAQTCPGCDSVHAIAIARTATAPGGIVPTITLRCVACDRAEALVPA